MGLATQLGLSPFQGSVNLRFDYTGKTRYDGLNLQWERRFSGFWAARAGYTLGYARGNNNGASLANNNFQVLAEKNLDLNYGPLDTDRRHNFTLSGRLEVPRTKGLTVSGLFRIMTGRPFTIHDSNVDADRNNIAFDPLPAGTYTGEGANAITVENKGGRNGAYGPNYAQLDARVGYRVRAGARQDPRSLRRGVQRDRPVQLHQPIGRQTSKLPGVERPRCRRVPAADAARRASRVLRATAIR